MKKINGVLFLSMFVFGTLAALTAEAHDELYYSAAICTPVWQHGFDGSGEQGFRWNVGGAFWENRDEDNEEWLVCPIPFDRSNLAHLKCGQSFLTDTIPKAFWPRLRAKPIQVNQSWQEPPDREVAL